MNPGCGPDTPAKDHHTLSDAALGDGDRRDPIPRGSPATANPGTLMPDGQRREATSTVTGG